MAIVKCQNPQCDYFQKPVPEGDFCPFCGEALGSVKLEIEQSDQTPPTPPQPPTNPPVVYQPQPAQPAYQPQPAQPAYQPQPAQPAYQPQPVQPVYQPQPAQPAYQPQPAQPAYQPQPAQPAYQPQPVQPAYQPQPVQPAYQPQPVQPAYQPQPAQPAYQPQPAQPAYQPQPLTEKSPPDKTVVEVFAPLQTHPALKLIHSSGQEFPFHGKIAYIGRRGGEKKPEPEIDLTDLPYAERISRPHAHIFWDERSNGYIIVDDRSANGTILNGTILKPLQPYPLPNGAQLEFGREQMIKFTVQIQ